jgi:hypothetical protein
MSTPRANHPALLFTAILFSKDVDIKKVITQLQDALGAVLVQSRPVGFVWSDYYQEEMGEDLNRVFVVYKDLVQRDHIVKVKRLTDDIEKSYMFGDKRTVNIDPGLICPENIILATNKPFFHRIYLSEGVYAEVTLFFRNNTYNPIELWTYPEYRSSPVLDFFNSVRAGMLSTYLSASK